MQKYQRDAGVADQQGEYDGTSDTMLEGQRRYQHHHGRIQEQDEPFQSRADVLQPKEIEITGEIIAEQPQPDDC